MTCAETTRGMGRKNSPVIAATTGSTGISSFALSWAASTACRIETHERGQHL
jgi:hypothetical protein